MHVAIRLHVLQIAIVRVLSRQESISHYSEGCSWLRSNSIFCLEVLCDEEWPSLVNTLLKILALSRGKKKVDDKVQAGTNSRQRVADEPE